MRDLEGDEGGIKMAICIESVQSRVGSSAIPATTGTDNYHKVLVMILLRLLRPAPYFFWGLRSRLRVGTCSP